jgi:hypothetical protein
VLRAVFRACYNRFRKCAGREKHFGHVRLEYVGGKDRRQIWGMKDEEYAADFILTARRSLGEEEFSLFRFHFLLGADWKLCCRRMSLDRGEFFHQIYRIQQRLGRMFHDLKPYPLYPLDDYFAGTVQRVQPCPVLKMQPRRRFFPPLRKAA